MRGQRLTTDVATIKDCISPHDFYLREQNLCRYGHRSSSWAIAGLCPFHNDTRPGSFKINVKTGAFKCWSCGTYGGDIIAFIQQRDGLSFSEILGKLAREWGVF